MGAYDIIMEDRKKLVEKLIKNMENGDLIFKKGWNISMLRPQNPISDVIYQGGNRLRLMAAAIEKEYDDPRWMTFKQAKEKGYKVKKGEKGILCEKWIFTKKVKEKDPETGKMVEVEKELDKPIPAYFTVFNGKQVDGIPPYKDEVKLEKNQISEIINDVIKTSECPIKEIAQDRAYYSPTKDEIILPLRSSFKSEENFLATALHEMGHSTGHESRLNREQKNFFGTEKYAREELVAELCSVFTQARLNLKLEGEHFNNHTAYLNSWIKALKNDSNELFRAAAEAEKAADRLYNNYLEIARKQIKELENSITNQANANSKPFFRGLVIDFEYSEKDLGVKEDTVLRGVEAYKFIEKLMAEDKAQNKIKQYILDEEEKGNRVPGLLYYKTKLEFQYKDYNTGKIRIDLGDLEFGGKEKVADALEYRLKSWPNELIDKKYEFAKYEQTTSEKIVETAKDILAHIDRIIEPLRRQEKLYLESLQQQKELLIPKDREIIKENSWTQKIQNDKIKQLTLGR